MENLSSVFVDFIRDEEQRIQVKDGRVLCTLLDEDGNNYETFVDIKQLKDIGALALDEINQQICQTDPIEIVNNGHDELVDTNENYSKEETSNHNYQSDDEEKKPSCSSKATTLPIPSILHSPTTNLNPMNEKKDLIETIIKQQSEILKFQREQHLKCMKIIEEQTKHQVQMAGIFETISKNLSKESAKKRKRNVSSSDSD